MIKCLRFIVQTMMYANVHAQRLIRLKNHKNVLCVKGHTNYTMKKFMHHKICVKTHKNLKQAKK